MTLYSGEIAFPRLSQICFAVTGTPETNPARALYLQDALGIITALGTILSAFPHLDAPIRLTKKSLYSGARPAALEEESLID